MEQSEAGLVAVTEGDAVPFGQIGYTLVVLHPGEPSALYHLEPNQEDFLVLSGECLAIIEGEERRLRAWDFVHCPPGTEHVFVGAGDGPAAILMVGARGDDQGVHYPVSEAASRHDASVERETSDPAEAYAPWGGYSPAENRWPPA
jgi:uncharacterized cupin superfamily protein